MVDLPVIRSIRKGGEKGVGEKAVSRVYLYTQVREEEERKGTSNSRHLAASRASQQKNGGGGEPSAEPFILINCKKEKGGSPSFYPQPGREERRERSLVCRFLFLREGKVRPRFSNDCGGKGDERKRRSSFCAARRRKKRKEEVHFSIGHAEDGKGEGMKAHHQQAGSTRSKKKKKKEKREGEGGDRMAVMNS